MANRIAREFPLTYGINDRAFLFRHGIRAVGAMQTWPRLPALRLLQFAAVIKRLSILRLSGLRPTHAHLFMRFWLFQLLITQRVHAETRGAWVRSQTNKQKPFDCFTWIAPKFNHAKIATPKRQSNPLKWSRQSFVQDYFETAIFFTKWEYRQHQVVKEIINFYAQNRPSLIIQFEHQHVVPQNWFLRTNFT